MQQAPRPDASLTTTKKKKKVNRSLRSVVDYATHGGRAPLAKHRPLSEFVPQLQLQKQQQQLKDGVDTARHATTREGLQLLPDAAARLQATGLVRSLPHRHAQAVAALAATTVNAAGARVHRCVVATEAEWHAIVLVAALQRAAAVIASAAADGSAAAAAPTLLVVCGVDDDARGLALALTTAEAARGGIVVPPPLIDGSERLPAYPSASSPPPPQSQSSPAAAAAAIVVFVATPAGLAAVDGRSALFHHVGALVVVHAHKYAAAASAASASGDDQQQQLLQRRQVLAGLRRHRSSRSVVHRLASVLVLADSLATVVDAASPVLGALTHAGADVDESGGGAAAAAAPPASRLSVMTCDGIARFQALYALLLHHAANPATAGRVVVHFIARETCAFVLTALVALGECPELRVLCDSEQAPSAADDGAGGARGVRADLRQAAATGERFVADFDAWPRARGGVVLLSSLALLPTTADVLLRYDPIPCLGRFIESIALRTTSSSNSSGGGGGAVHRETTPTPPPARKGGKRSRTPPPPTPPPTPPVQPLVERARFYPHVVVLAYPSEAAATVSLLEASASAFCSGHQHSGSVAQRLIAVERIPAPAAALLLVSSKKLHALQCKTFALQSAAYAAYRALMQAYARLRPHPEVFDVARLELDTLAQQFGYAGSAPLLDLRTKDTVFRPREDVYKQAVRRLVADRRAMRRFANANLVGEGPEPHVTGPAGEA